MTTAPQCGDRRAPLLIADEVIATGAHLSDHVVIAGAQQLELLLALIRRGFANVSCQSAAQGPASAEGETDVLIVPSMADDADLPQILQRLGCAVRHRGALIIHGRAAGNSDGDCRLRQALVQAGFTAIERVPSRDGLGDFWCAHKYGAALAHAA